MIAGKWLKVFGCHLAVVLSDSVLNASYLKSLELVNSSQIQKFVKLNLTFAYFNFCCLACLVSSNELLVS